DAGGQMTFAGPTVSDTASMIDGIQYTSSNGWTTAAHNSTTGVKMTLGSSQFQSSLSGSVSPYLRMDFGIAGFVGDCDILLCYDLGGVNLAYAKTTGDFRLQLNPPLNDLDAQYRGPTWSTGVDFTAGPEVVLNGGIAKLLQLIGIDPPSVEWVLFNKDLPVANSPDITVTSSAAPGGSVNLTASVPDGFSGDMVKFVAYPSSGRGGTIVATSTVSGKSATAAWKPNN